MESGFSLKTALQDVLGSLTGSVAEFLPRALTALVVVLLGFILAKLVARAIRLAFARLRIDEMLDKFGLTDILGKLGLQGPPGKILARLTYYLLLLLFVQSGAQAIGLTAVADAISAFFAYLPNLLAGVIVLIIGLLFGQFAGGAVTRSARDSGVEFAPILGRIVSALIIFVAGLMAVTQLQIDTDIIRSVVLVILAGISLAMALSFGLGTRDITRNLVAGFYARKLFQPGERITIDEHTGILMGISPLQVLVEVDEEITAIPNSVFLDKAVRQ